MKILLIAGAVMVLLLAAGYLKQQDRNSDGSQNSVTSIEALSLIHIFPIIGC